MQQQQQQQQPQVPAMQQPQVPTFQPQQAQQPFQYLPMQQPQPQAQPILQPHLGAMAPATSPPPGVTHLPGIPNQPVYPSIYHSHQQTLTPPPQKPITPPAHAGTVNMQQLKCSPVIQNTHVPAPQMQITPPPQVLTTPPPQDTEEVTNELSTPKSRVTGKKRKNIPSKRTRQSTPQEPEVEYLQEVVQ